MYLYMPIPCDRVTPFQLVQDKNEVWAVYRQAMQSMSANVSERNASLKKRHMLLLPFSLLSCRWIFIACMYMNEIIERQKELEERLAHTFQKSVVDQGSTSMFRKLVRLVYCSLDLHSAVTRFPRASTVRLDCQKADWYSLYNAVPFASRVG